jgi:DNA mismatch repair ATPase MutS
MLKLLEKEHNETFGNQLNLGMLMNVPNSSTPKKEESEIEKELEKIEVNNLTPIEALNELVRLKRKMKDKTSP